MDEVTIFFLLAPEVSEVVRRPEQRYDDVFVDLMEVTGILPESDDGRMIVGGV